MDRYVLGFQEIDGTRLALIGGKAANLAELSRIDGLNVPAGFCVTTDAFRRTLYDAKSIDQLIERLSHVRPDDRDAIRAVSAEIREIIETLAVPDDVAAAIAASLDELGAHAAYAVRSSATAEDLPTASFAGQQDSFLDVIGSAAVVEHVRRCWASLFTERAVTYRQRNGIDHRKVYMAVVVQRMVAAHAAGVLFTADPVTGNRKLASVEAVFGFGDALVSGLVNADAYKARDDAIVSKSIVAERAALTDAQVVRLVQLGRGIEAHFGRPQDIEWCLVDDEFHVVQSRPVTTLYPIPEVADAANHVYVSVGHQQMMTDAMKPLGVAFRQLTAATTFHEAGGRVFVDISRALASPAGRAGLMSMLGKSDPLIGDAIQTVIDRGFIPTVDDQAPSATPPAVAPAPLATDPAIVAELIERVESSLAALKRDIEPLSGSAMLDFIAADFPEFKRVLFDARSHQAIMAGMEAAWWLNDHLHEWLGEKNAADTLTLSVANNITSEMGLALLDVADVIRPHADVVAFLGRVGDDDQFLDELPALAGGREARAAIDTWLDRYGMRGVGEIDITRPRWSERPSTLVPLILGNIRNSTPGAARRRFEQGRQEAWTKEQDLLARLRLLPNGEEKAAETKRMIDRVRTFAGYREYPKYGMVGRYFVYKQAMLAEADRLVRDGVLRDREDIYWLTFDELRDVVRTQHVDDALLRRRAEAFRSYQGLTPPRVLTSEGEAVAAAYRRDDSPAGALIGLPVSPGTVEGRARVLLDLAAASVERGDILVTTFTDPSWTPLFVAVAGLVTEVGGFMTHGAVIAREYGLPAVVGVEHATRLIRDGQRIRVHATDGYVELLD